MSEFMEKHTVARLVGAPPGYVGYDDGGQLTEAVRRRPYRLILLDEIEKAHPDVFNMLLQIFDDGHLTDAQGPQGRLPQHDHHHDLERRGAAMIADQRLARLPPARATPSRPARHRVDYERMKDKVQQELKAIFRPEFLNRLDATVVFRSLTVEEITRIVDLMLKRVRDQLKAQGMDLVITQAAKEHVIKVGYDQAYGARPLRRTIQNLIEDPLSEHLLLGRYQDGDTINIDLDPDGKGLAITAVEAKTPVEA